MTPGQQRAMFEASWFEVSGRVARGEIKEDREYEILALFIAATPTAKVRADLRSLDALYAAARGQWSDDEYRKTRRLYTDAISTRKLVDPVAPWPQAQLDAAFAEVSEEDRSEKEAEVRKLHEDLSGVTSAKSAFRKKVWLAAMLTGIVFAISSLFFSHPVFRFSCFAGIAYLCTPLGWQHLSWPTEAKVASGGLLGVLLFLIGVFI